MMNYTEIFQIWKTVCSQYNTRLCDTWNQSREYTNTILTYRDSLLYEFAKALNLKFYLEYYNLDAVFYEEDDKVSSTVLHETWTDVYGFWLRNIKIAFEHENCIWGAHGAFQEMCRLLTTNAEYKVLVSYALAQYADNCAQDLQSIIKNTADTVLLILGDRKDNQVCWKGYELTAAGVNKLP